MSDAVNRISYHTNQHKIYLEYSTPLGTENRLHRQESVEGYYMSNKFATIQHEGFTLQFQFTGR